MFVFSVRCDCGAESTAHMDASPEATGPAPVASVEREQVERAAWAKFVHAARKGRCRSCQNAAGRWLRNEPMFSAAVVRP